jgi:cell division septum initiation protein DivIVA
MAMTLLDAENARFRVAFRGYAREDVERFRAGMVAALEEQVALAQRLSAQVNTLEADMKRYHDKEDLLRDSVVLAQRTCDELIAVAHKQADAIKREARSGGEAISQEYSQLRAQREQFEYAFYGLLTGFLTRLEQGNPQLSISREALRELSAASQKDETLLHGATPGEDRLTAPKPQVSTEQSTEQDPQHGSVPNVPPLAFGPIPRVANAKRAVGSTPGGDIDRDADIAGFAAAIDEASASEDAPWPGQQNPGSTSHGS